MTDGISQTHRDAKDRAQTVQECEAACVVLSVLWSNPFQLPKARRKFYRWGQEVSPEEAEEISARSSLDPMDYPPIDWARACELLGLPELGESDIPLLTGGQKLTARSLRRLDIRLDDAEQEIGFIKRLRNMDREAWATVVHASDQKAFDGHWRQRLKALSPFSEAEIIVLSPDDKGPAAGFIRRIARNRGWIAEVTWLRNRGREEKLMFVSVPRYG